MALAEQVAPSLASSDALFDEICQLNEILSSLPAQAFESCVDFWQKFFSIHQSLPCIYRLVSIIFSIPISNAFVERIFSLCNSQWTKERNRLLVDTVKSLVQCQVNFDYTCAEMRNVIASNGRMIKKIRAGDKYSKTRISAHAREPAKMCTYPGCALIRVQL